MSGLLLCASRGSCRGVFRLPRGSSIPSGNEIEPTVVPHSDTRRVGIRQRNASAWGTRWGIRLSRTLSPAVVRVARARRRAVIWVQDCPGQKGWAQDQYQEHHVRPQRAGPREEHQHERREDQHRQ
jgi:hypothetical protein